MNEKKSPWVNWVLYFGSQDERHHRAADRAGHVAYLLCLAAAGIDFIVRAPLWKHDLLGGFLATTTDLVVILVAGGYYSLQWVRSGITLRDTAPQRRFLFWLCPATGLVTLGVLVFQWQKDLGWGWASLIGAVGGLVAWALCWFLYQWMDKAASREP